MLNTVLITDGCPQINFQGEDVFFDTVHFTCPPSNAKCPNGSLPYYSDQLMLCKYTFE